MDKFAMQAFKRGQQLGSALMLAMVCLSASAETLQVVTEDSSYSYLQNGKVAGQASDIVQATLALAGIKDYHMALYPWARSYDMARLEPNVLIYPIIRSHEREPLFKWVGELEEVTQMFYKLRARTDIQVADLQDAKRLSVGVVRDDSRQQYLETKGFTRMVVSANNLDNLRKLVSGQITLLPMPEREARDQCLALDIDFEDLEPVYTLDELSKGLYVALSVNTPDETVSQVRQAFAQLKADGTVARMLKK